MPSDDRIAQALSALKRPRDVFHSAVVTAVEEVNAFLAAQRAPADERAAQESDRLGSFALGHIDIDRFSRLVDEKQVLDPARLEGLEHALRVLKGFAVQGDELYHVRVEEGADLRDTVRDALAVRGRAFSTAQLIEVLRTGHNGRRSDFDYGTLDFRRWSRAERLLAPPLVVEVPGSDLHVAGLAEYLDGAQKIVLVVVGPASPAPLARLIAPRTFVMQTTDPSALRRLAGYDGPGIAALMPEGAVSLVHDPSRGESLARRLEVGELPQPSQRAVAGGSVRQQAEELAWLGELARLASAARELADEQPADAVVTPADQLAAWLLRQTDLTAVE
ncbi:MAG TPA: hypothetical protein VK936_14595 [Longimicrobiales bacterium]|nr:hypothetical protein [Longimicrobiales bacterium]